MFPSEMVILMAISGGRSSGQKLLNRPMDVAGEYIGYLYGSLVRRGYLEGNRSRGYRLTLKGRESLLEFLRQNKTRVQDTMRTLQQLGIESSQKMDRLVQEAVEVK